MSGFYKLAKVSEGERRKMPFDTLIRCFYKAKVANECTSHMRAPESVRVVSARNLHGYVEEITRRLQAMWTEEAKKYDVRRLEWECSARQVEAGLEYRPEHRA